MADDLQAPEIIKRAQDLVNAVSPLFAGQGGDVQGAALVDLVAIHLAGHIVRGDDEATAEMRELFAAGAHRCGARDDPGARAAHPRHSARGAGLMPGPVSDSYQGPPDDGPYVPAWCYPNSTPKMCPCGHHEGYHADNGACLRQHQCLCTGLPIECRTSSAEFYASLGEKKS